MALTTFSLHCEEIHSLYDHKLFCLHATLHFPNTNISQSTDLSFHIPEYRSHRRSPCILYQCRLAMHLVPRKKKQFIILLRFCSMKRLVTFYYFTLDGVLVHHRISSMKQLGVLLLPSGWDASPSQGTQHEATRSITATLWMGC